MVLLLLIILLITETACCLVFFCVAARLTVTRVRFVLFCTVCILLLLFGVLDLTVLWVLTRTELVLTCGVRFILLLVFFLVVERTLVFDFVFCLLLSLCTSFVRVLVLVIVVPEDFLGARCSVLLLDLLITVRFFVTFVLVPLTGLDTPFVYP